MALKSPANSKQGATIMGLTWLIWLVAPVLVICMLWFPLLVRYYVSVPNLTSAIIEEGRFQPNDSRLEEFETFHFLDENWKDDAQLVAAAEELLQNTLEIPGVGSTKFRFPFRSSDIDQEPPGLQLYVGGFVAPEILLRAYLLTGREDFFVASRNFITSWASYEQNTWVPHGLIWNDHALSARVAVLTKFWRLYRHRADFDQQVARSVFELVNRSARLIAKPELFTFATAHGMLENLALAEVCIAFPSLPGAESYGRIASERLKDQLEYYINDEGIVLEHSAGYHVFGVAMVGAAMRDLTLLGQPVPVTLWEKYIRAQNFYQLLVRPDGSLPIYGDTRSIVDSQRIPVTFPDQDGRALPLVRVPLPRLRNQKVHFIRSPATRYGGKVLSWYLPAV